MCKMIVQNDPFLSQEDSLGQSLPAPERDSTHTHTKVQKMQIVQSCKQWDGDDFTMKTLGKNQEQVFLQAHLWAFVE